MAPKFLDVDASATLQLAKPKPCFRPELSAIEIPYGGSELEKPCAPVGTQNQLLSRTALCVAIVKPAHSNMCYLFLGLGSPFLKVYVHS